MDTHQQLLTALHRLLQAKNRKPGTYVRLTQQTLVMICTIAKDVIQNEPVIHDLSPPINVVGDIHGQFFDLLRIFDTIGHPPDQKYLFLGDYVDRGRQSIETVAILLVYKILYPEHIYLLRGNHECPEVNEIHGFKSECVSRYSPRLWNVINEVFTVFPIAALIGKKIFCIHAGISPDMPSIKFFDTLERPITKVTKPVLDLMWSDPDPLAEEFSKNPRGTSCVFGLKQVQKFLEDNDLEVVIRAHQMVSGGFEFPFEPERCFVTVFSAPCSGIETDNDGAIMNINESLNCSFTFIKPLERRLNITRPPKSDIEEILNMRNSSAFSRSLPGKKWGTFS